MSTGLAGIFITVRARNSGRTSGRGCDWEGTAPEEAAPQGRLLGVNCLAQQGTKIIQNKVPRADWAQCSLRTLASKPPFPASPILWGVWAGYEFQQLSCQPLALALNFPEIFEDDAKRALLPDSWHVSELKTNKQTKTALRNTQTQK